MEIVAHVVKPDQLSPTSIQPQAFKVPAGFSVSVFGESLGKPRMLEPMPANMTWERLAALSRQRQEAARPGVALLDVLGRA